MPYLRTTPIEKVIHPEPRWEAFVAGVATGYNVDPSVLSHPRRNRHVRSMRLLVLLILGGSFLNFGVVGADEKLPPKQVEFFETHIRPVLIDQCYACHNSAKTAEAGIAVDSRAGMVDSGIIEPGKPAESSIIQAIRHQINDSEMPKDGPKLNDAIIKRFEQWIEIGAPDPRDAPPSESELEQATSWDAILERRKAWWSFQPIAKVAIPPSTGLPQHWQDNAIDRFIYAGFKEKRLSPAVPADPHVLVRRLYFSLIGLPPSFDQVTHWAKAIESDPETGYSELVDHLLDSPQYGERWARHWMDWIRYAESHGSEGDPRIDNAWYYRDYLIRALNQDVPYNQLVREHIAGDLLAKPRINHELRLNESAIGPAHWRMVFHGFAPTDALDEKVRFVDDQVNAFSKAFMGLTVSCARCHDHKFDAISQKDYYALFGILAACRPARTVVDTPKLQAMHSSELAKQKSDLRAALASDWLTNIPETQQLLQKAKALNDPEQILHPLHQAITAIQKGASVQDAWETQAKRIEASEKRRRDFVDQDVIAAWDFSKPADVQQWFASGHGLRTPLAKPGEFALRSDGDALMGIYPSGVYSHLLSTKHAARFTSPDIQLGEHAVLWLQVMGDQGAQSRYVVQDYPRNGTVYPVTNLKPKWTWQRYDLKYWSGDSIHIEVAAGKDAPLLVKNSDRSWFGIRRAMLVKAGAAGPEKTPESLRLILNAASNSPESLQEIAEWYVSSLRESIKAWQSDQATDAEADMLSQFLNLGLLPNSLQKLKNSAPLIAKFRKAESQVAIPRRVPGLDEVPGRVQPLYVRGNHKTPGDITPRGFLQAFNDKPYDVATSGRVALANDLLSQQNPLTRRVIVNRIWHHLFGQGIVATPDNFGRLGQKPSHPELLDYLAEQFANEGWSIKQLIRQIVHTQTWRQSVLTDKATMELDPDNRMLTRANVRRLDAEAIRDAMLAVSGRLDKAQFGPAVNINSNRRSVYVSVIRNSLPPLLRAFDFPEPFSTTGRRSVTNVPAQSLMLMNDRQVLAYAQSMANAAAANGKDNRERVAWMMANALSRQATESEIQSTLAMLEDAKSDAEKMRVEMQGLQQRKRQLENGISGIEGPIRKRLLTELQKEANGADQPPDASPAPLHSWDFSRPLSAISKDLKLTLVGGAKYQDGVLLVGGGGYAITEPLRTNLREKTLEAWVQLSNREQRGGGVMTIQTRNGVTFDSIVFGEQQPGHWLAGSNNFQRTSSFRGAAESQAHKQYVHIAIVYQPDGKIIGYRNGQPYGSPYRSAGLQEFKAGDTVISFGIRHLPSGGNRSLAGKIQKANLYDRALTADEILATSHSTVLFIAPQQIKDALSPEQSASIAKWKAELEKTEQRITGLANPPRSDDQALLTELARALFTLKEFIFIR